MTAAHPYPSAFTIPEAKVAGYLLNLDSDDGASKAALLMRFGFSPDRPLDLMDALGRHPSPELWTAAFEAPHGMHYFEGPLLSPDGRNPYIRSVWQVDYDGDGSTAKFVTDAGDEIARPACSTSGPGRTRSGRLGGTRAIGFSRSASSLAGSSSPSSRRTFRDTFPSAICQSA